MLASCFSKQLRLDVGPQVPNWVRLAQLSIPPTPLHVFLNRCIMEACAAPHLPEDCPHMPPWKALQSISSCSAWKRLYRQTPLLARLPPVRPALQNAPSWASREEVHTKIAHENFKSRSFRDSYAPFCLRQLDEGWHDVLSMLISSAPVNATSAPPLLFQAASRRSTDAIAHTSCCGRYGGHASSLSPAFALCTCDLGPPFLP